MLSEEGQQILVQRDFVPTSKKLPSPIGNTPLKMVDAALVLDEYEKWTKLYEDIFVGKSR
jgi:iron(III) transport system substrate-binding protein